MQGFNCSYKEGIVFPFTKIVSQFQASWNLIKAVLFERSFCISEQHVD